MNKEQAAKETPFEELREEALRHYEEISSRACHWNSFVPAAIKAYNPAGWQANASHPEWVSVKERLPKSRAIYFVRMLHMEDKPERDNLVNDTIIFDPTDGWVNNDGYFKVVEWLDEQPAGVRSLLAGTTPVLPFFNQIKNNKANDKRKRS